jgi:hypothetical protein
MDNVYDKIVLQSHQSFQDHCFFNNDYGFLNSF